MKKKLFFISFLSLFYFSCDEDCKVMNTLPECNEQPPSTELCQANWTRWFFDSNSNQCQEITYTGCNIYGFDTKTDCEQCKCD